MINKLIRKIYFKYKFILNNYRIIKIKILGSKIGKGTISYGRFTVINYPYLDMGENSTINEGVQINCRAKVKIGNNVHISSNVQIHTGKLILKQKPRFHDEAPIEIKNNVWIASSVVILAGVIIGENSVIAAGSVVTKDIPANSLAMGVPAKVKKLI